MAPPKKWKSYNFLAHSSTFGQLKVKFERRERRLVIWERRQRNVIRCDTYHPRMDTINPVQRYRKAFLKDGVLSPDTINFKTSLAIIKSKWCCRQIAKSPHRSPDQLLIHPQQFSSSSSLKSSNPPSAPAPGREGNKSPSPRCRQHLLPLVDHLPALRLGIWKNHPWHMESSCKMIGSWITWNGSL